METYWLTCHPDTPGKAIKAISAKVSHATADNIGVWFDLYGDSAQLVWPGWAPPSRADNLWKSTCLEIFIADSDGAGYREFNFSPSGAWAGYRFTAYREGMTDLRFDRVPEVYEATKSPDSCSIILRIVAQAKREVRFALSAVIEELDGTKSYWALAHPPGKPDFHHPTCFAATLPAPE